MIFVGYNAYILSFTLRNMSWFVLLRLNILIWYDSSIYLNTSGDRERLRAVVTNRLIPTGPYSSTTVLGPLAGSMPFPRVHSSPGSPKRWSPWRWVMKILLIFPEKKKTFSDAQQIQTRRKVENNMFLLFSWNIISKDRIYYVLKKVMYISKTSHTFRSINQSCWFLQWNYTPIISTWFNRAFLQLNLASFPAVKQPNLSYRCYITGTQFIWTQGYRDYSSSGRLLSSPPYHAYLT